MGRQRADTALNEPPAVTPAPVRVAAEWLSLSKLHGWDRNPKRHGETIPKLVRAIIRWGWGPPIEARRENGEIIAGHGRMQAAERLSARWKKASERARSKWHPEAVRVAAGEVPVRYRDLDEDDAHEAAIADNRIGEDSEWDKDLLAEHLEEFEDDADLMGFDASEIDGMVGEAADRSQLVEVCEVNATFTLTVTGPLASQQRAIDAIRCQLGGIEGITFDCFVEDQQDGGLGED